MPIDDFVEMRRKQLIARVEASSYPDKEMHELFKSHQETIIQTAIIEWMHNITTLKINNEDELVDCLEKWVSEFVKNSFKG